MNGTTISHYKVSEKIGQGGMGEAFDGFSGLKTLRLTITFTNRIKTKGGTMRNDQWISKYLGAWSAPALLLLFQLSSAFGQLAPEVAQLGYADTIFVNGKVVSMDDSSRSTSVGNI